MTRLQGQEHQQSQLKECNEGNRSEPLKALICHLSTMSWDSAWDEASVTKKKRSLPGHPDPDAEVIALSPRSLLATNRFVCEICHKGFQRDQNLQLHRRGHNLPWRLKQKASHETVRKKVYVCPEPSCAHHDPARALGDLTGIKKHFSRKHGEKKWKCDKCSKRYAVQSDWKAHQKTCGTREYRCDCGTLFSRRDSFITHRAFCDALAEENVRVPSQTPRGQDMSQQAATINTYVNGREMAPTMRGPSSPSSQLSRDAALTNSDMSNPSMAPGQASEFGCQQEGSMASWSSNLYTNGFQAHAPSKSSKSPGLSLHLGMEPGPGPPGPLQNLMANSTLSTGTPPSFLSSTSSNSLHNLGFFEMPGSDNTIHASAASIGATGMLSTFFSSPEKSFSRQDDAGNSSMGNASGYVGLMAELDQPPTPPFMFSTSRNATNPLNTSLSYPSSPSLSATALLQKAAQMGSTASKPFWMQKLGVGSGESTEIQNQVKWSGLSSMFTSQIPGKEAERMSAVRGEARSDVAEDCCGYTEPGYGSMQEIMKPASGGSSSLATAWTGMSSSSYSTASKPRGLQQHGRMQKTDEATAMVDFLGVEAPMRNEREHWPN